MDQSYRVGQVVNGHVWTGLTWLAFTEVPEGQPYQVGQVVNQHAWTGQEWLPLLESSVLPQQVEVVDHPASDKARHSRASSSTTGDIDANRSSGSAPMPLVTKALESYDVIYLGGLRDLPKSKMAKIKMEIHDDRFQILPTAASKKFWTTLQIPYGDVVELEVVDRTVSTFEGLAGGLNSRQLNQKNNIHLRYSAADGLTLLRLEMLSGITVMGQAKKCVEMEDRLRAHRVRERFADTQPKPASSGSGLGGELERISALHASGVLSDQEFTSAKARLLGL